MVTSSWQQECKVNTRIRPVEGEIKMEVKKGKDIWLSSHGASEVEWEMKQGLWSQGHTLTLEPWVRVTDTVKCEN